MWLHAGVLHPVLDCNDAEGRPALHCIHPDEISLRSPGSRAAAIEHRLHVLLCMPDASLDESKR